MIKQTFKIQTAVLLLTCSILFILVACTNSQDEKQNQNNSSNQSESNKSDTTDEVENYSMTFGSYGTGGRGYIEAGHISNLLSDKLDNVDMKVSSSLDSGVMHIKEVNTGNLDIGVAYASEVESAAKGEPPYFEGEQQDNLSVWFRFSDVYQTMLVDESINDISELKGKTIAISGLPGTGMNIMGKLYLEYHGLNEGDYTLQEIGREPAVDAIINGQADAALIDVTRNNQQHQGRAFSSRDNIKMLPADPKAAEKMVADYPEYVLDDIGDTELGYPNVLRVAEPIFKVIRKDLPEELVYQLTKELFDDREELYKTLQWYEEYANPELSTIADVNAPLHPGAYKYYKEVGTPDIPDTAIPE